MVYTALIIVGAAVPLNLVWNIADITTILMALPNLLAVFLFSGAISRRYAYEDAIVAPPQ